MNICSIGYLICAACWYSRMAWFSADIDKQWYIIFTWTDVADKTNYPLILQPKSKILGSGTTILIDKTKL